MVGTGMVGTDMAGMSLDRPSPSAPGDARDDRKSAIRQRAVELGFDAIGFASPRADANDGAHLATFLAEDRHGDMAWMASSAERRADPQRQWPDVRTVIVVGLNYGPDGDPMLQLERRGRGAISVYAQGRDYHKLLGTRLKALGRWISETFACSVKTYVDTAPVMEKPLAMRAGLGWTGKHTNLVSRRSGSWLFLGEVFVDLEIAPDPPEVDHCGSCDRCLRACPTDALAEPYRIDPRRCISYLTIEHKGRIPDELRVHMGNRIYGCDDCLAACPWTKFAAPTPHADLHPRRELSLPELANLADLDDQAFRELTIGSAIRRTGRDRFVRNVLMAIGNSGDRALAAIAERKLEDPSALVREAAGWAVERLRR